jgi:hypothetical protein
MTDNPINKICCRYCKEQINENAKVCFHCGHYQNNIQYIKYFATVISIVLSIGLLVVSIWQYREARNERIKAQEALVQAQEALMRAQKAEKKITESGKAIAKVILGLSTLKGSYDSFDVLKYFPGLMQSNSRLLLDAIEVSAKERQDIFELYNKLKEWQQLSDSEQKEKLGKEIEQLINR